MHRRRNSIRSLGRAGWLTLFALLAWPAAEARAGKPASPYWGDAVVATVTEVSGHAATYGNPPRVKLDVQEVFQGDPEAERGDAVWAPPPHDVDTGTIYDDPRYKQWAATTMTGPDAGSRWILYGWLFAEGPGKAALFYASSETAKPFSEQELARAKQRAAELAAERRKLAEEREADRQANARIKALWRLLTTRVELEKYTAEADLIVTGRWTSAASSANAIGVQVTSILKGTLRERPRKGADDSKPDAPDGGEDDAGELKRDRFIDLAVGPALEVLMDRDTEYLLFLSDDGLTFSPVSACYQRIRTGDGVVIADDDALRAVQEALRRDAERAKGAAPPDDKGPE